MFKTTSSNPPKKKTVKNSVLTPAQQVALAKKNLAIAKFKAEFESRWIFFNPDLPLATEVLIVPGRLFRWDYAHITSRTLLELQGGIYNKKMGHSSAQGITNDAVKNIRAQEQGWVSVQITQLMWQGKCELDLSDIGRMLRKREKQLLANAREKMRR